MADSKISALTAVTTAASTDEFAVNQSGTSKKETLAQIRAMLPTLPTIVSVGTEFHSTGTPTATLPGTHALNDILVLVLQSSNERLTAPAGYAQIGPQVCVGASATAGSVRMGIFWRRDNGSATVPTIVDSGDHTYGVMFAVRGCPTTGDPFHFLGNRAERTASTTLNQGEGWGGNVSVNNCLVTSIAAHAIDSATSQGSAELADDLTSLTIQFDGSTTDGTGGGIYILSGTRATAGYTRAPAATWAASTVDVQSLIAWLPSDAGGSSPFAHAPEIQIFYGTPADLDDTWTKPTGAINLFVQLCDGGGGGSGGNTTTTAEGGGGGGGGGYDEQWLIASDIVATATVHAGKGGAAGTALLQAGNAGVVSQFNKGQPGPLTSVQRIAGTAATAAASANGGKGGCGSGRGAVSPAVATTRIDLTAATAGAALGAVGGRGGSGTTAPVGGSPADWGGGGGESGADTDAATAAASNGWSLRGGGGGAGGRTNTNVSIGGYGGGVTTTGGSQGDPGADSGFLPYGGAGGNGGGSSTVTGGTGGFPGGGGGGGAGVAGGFGGKGGDGCVVVTTHF